MMGSRRVTELVNQCWPPILTVLTRSVIEPAFGTPFLTTARWLEDFDSWSPERRRRWQLRRLSEVLEHAGRFVPRYQDLASGSTPLDQLPIVDKATMRAATEDFTSTAPGLRTITKRTGGSTGDPWIYALDRRAFTHMYGAQIRRFEMHGQRYGERRLFLGAPDSLGLVNPSRSKRIRLRLERNATQFTGLAIDDSTSIVRAVRATDYGAMLWYGYAGTTAAVARAILEHGLRLDSPRLVVTMAEKLYPEWRREIEAAFPHATVVEEYGCNDGGVLAHSCAAGNLHVADNISIVEILDGGRRCSEGEEGEVTITNLHARAMPFLRYQVGDRAVVGPSPCPCGQPGTTIASIQGRTGDRVLLQDGREFGPSAFTQPFKRTPAVRRWQVIHRDNDALEVRLDADATFDRDQHETIEAYLRRTLGPAVGIEVTTNRPLLRTPGGKHRVVVSELHSPADDERVRADTSTHHKEMT